MIGVVRILWFILFFGFCTKAFSETQVWITDYPANAASGSNIKVDFVCKHIYLLNFHGARIFAILALKNSEEWRPVDQSGTYVDVHSTFYENRGYFNLSGYKVDAGKVVEADVKVICNVDNTDSSERSLRIVGVPQIERAVEYRGEKLLVKVRSGAASIDLNDGFSDRFACTKGTEPNLFLCESLNPVRKNSALELTAKDNIGQISRITLSNDSSPPAVGPVTILGTSFGSKNHVLIKFPVSDKATSFDTGVEKVWIYTESDGEEIGKEGPAIVNGNGAPEITVQTEVEVKSLESYKIFIWANDMVGNQRRWDPEKADYEKQFVEKTAPRVDKKTTISEYELLGKKYVKVEFEVLDKDSGVEKVWIYSESEGEKIGFNNKEITNGHGAKAITVTADVEVKSLKKYKIFIWANDLVGNQRKWDEDYPDFEKKGPSPEIRWTNPAKILGVKDLVKDKFAIQASVKADRGLHYAEIWAGNSFKRAFSCTQEGGSTNYACVSRIRIPDGLQDLWLRATDKDKNKGSWAQYKHVLVDTKEPILSLAAPVNGEIFNGTQLTVAGKLDDENPDHVSIKLRQKQADGKYSELKAKDVGTDDGSKEFSYTFDRLDISDYEVCAVAYDKVGNQSGENCVKVRGKVAPETLFQDFRLNVQPGSLEDRDASGGYSPGDAFEYLVSFKVVGGAKGVSIAYALPAGLERNPAKTGSISGAGSVAYRSDWTGGAGKTRLVENAELSKGQTVSLRIPVVVSRSVESPSLSSDVELTASNALSSLTRRHTLDLQARVDAHAGLQLTIQREPAQETYRKAEEFTYAVTLKALSWDLKNVELQYEVPAGLEKAGEAAVIGAGTASVSQTWPAKDRQLKIIVPALKVAQTMTVKIPLRVSESALLGAFIRSTVRARAANVSGELEESDEIRIEGERPSKMGLSLSLERVSAAKRGGATEAARAANRASPGETIEFKLNYHNLQARALRDVVIYESVGAEYEAVVSAWCDPGKGGARCCVESKRKPASACQTRVDSPGILRWRLGELDAGASGSLGYQVRVRR